MAAVVSEIACVDFPDNWTGLFDQLLSMMGTGDPNQVHGVMKVLSELASDITDSQVKCGWWPGVVARGGGGGRGGRVMCPLLYILYNLFYYFYLSSCHGN